jgi:hypothetical protein
MPLSLQSLIIRRISPVSVSKCYGLKISGRQKEVNQLRLALRGKIG